MSVMLQFDEHPLAPSNHIGRTTRPREKKPLRRGAEWDYKVRRAAGRCPVGHGRNYCLKVSVGAATCGGWQLLRPPSTDLEVELTGLASKFAAEYACLDGLASIRLALMPA